VVPSLHSRQQAERNATTLNDTKEQQTTISLKETVLDKSVKNVKRMDPIQNMATKTLINEQDLLSKGTGFQENAEKNKGEKNMYDNVESHAVGDSAKHYKLVTEELKERPLSSETEQKLITETCLQTVGVKKTNETKREEKETCDNAEMHSDADSAASDELVTKEFKAQPKSTKSNETEQELFTGTSLEKIAEGKINENNRQNENCDDGEIHTDAESVKNDKLVTEELKERQQSSETKQGRDKVKHETACIGDAVPETCEEHVTQVNMEQTTKYGAAGSTTKTKLWSQAADGLSKENNTAELETRYDAHDSIPGSRHFTSSGMDRSLTGTNNAVRAQLQETSKEQKPVSKSSSWKTKQKAKKSVSETHIDTIFYSIIHCYCC